MRGIPTPIGTAPTGPTIGGITTTTGTIPIGMDTTAAEIIIAATAALATMWPVSDTAALPAP